VPIPKLSEGLRGEGAAHSAGAVDDDVGVLVGQNVFDA
jgi:hypothetical protein